MVGFVANGGLLQLAECRSEGSSGCICDSECVELFLRLDGMCACGGGGGGGGGLGVGVEIGGLNLLLLVPCLNKLLRIEEGGGGGGGGGGDDDAVCWNRLLLLPVLNKLLKIEFGGGGGGGGGGDGT